MKIIESGMPGEEVWETFFDPEEILHKMDVSPELKAVADFGCGYGTFTLPAAQIVSGTVYAIDVERGLIDLLEDKVKQLGLKNIITLCRDIEAEGTGLSSESIDYVMLFNILHGSHPEKLVSEAYRVLRLGGRAGVIHWNYDSRTPRGPPMRIRLKPQQITRLAEDRGFKLEKKIDLKPYHYGLILRK